MTELTLSNGKHLQLGMIIPYSVLDKTFQGKIVQFKISDQRSSKNLGGWDSPWAKVQNVTSQEFDWISLNNWMERFKEAKPFMATTVASDENASSFI